MYRGNLGKSGGKINLDLKIPLDVNSIVNQSAETTLPDTFGFDETYFDETYFDTGQDGT